MALTDFQSSLHLALLYLAHSLRSLFVSYLCYIQKHHYECCRCGPHKLNNRNSKCKWPHIFPPTELGAKCMVAWKRCLVAAIYLTSLDVTTWHGAVDRPRTFCTLQNARQQHCNITVTVDSKCLHFLLLHRKI